MEYFIGALLMFLITLISETLRKLFISMPSDWIAESITEKWKKPYAIYELRILTDRDSNKVKLCFTIKNRLDSPITLDYELRYKGKPIPFQFEDSYPTYLESNHEGNYYGNIPNLSPSQYENDFQNYSLLIKTNRKKYKEVPIKQV